MAIIVYLDQSILSNIVKFRRGELKTSNDREVYSQLFDAIQNCVRKGCHVFPESPYHRLEADFDSRLSEDEWRYLKEISRRLEFEQPPHIVDVQIELALDRWLHNEQQQRIWWDGVFNRDPHSPWMPDAHEVYVRLGFSPGLLEHDRANKKLLPYFLAKIAPLTSARSLEEETELERQYIISHLFGPPGIVIFDTSIDGIARLIDQGKALSRLEYLKERSLDAAQIASFLQSQELSSIPMVDIQARLWGHLMINAAKRPPRGSDPSDIEIIAMTLPYCHIVTTDSYMQKVVVEDLKLADSYQAMVLSAKLKDVRKLTALLAK